MKLRNNKGITLTTLVITIIILLILSSITVYGGMSLIKRANVESLKTNMLLIQAEAKAIVEEINFRESALNGSEEENASKRAGIRTELLNGQTSVPTSEEIKNKMNSILSEPEENLIDFSNYYALNNEALQQMHVDTKVPDGEYYVVRYNFDNLDVEVYYTKGYNYKGKTYYALSELEKVID